MMTVFTVFVSLLVLLNLVHSQREDHVPEYEIPCSYLDGRLLEGNNEIQLSSQPDECLAEGELSIALSFPLTVSRWKAVRVQRPDDWDTAKSIVELECRNCDHTVRLSRKDLLDFGTIVLWQNPLLTVGHQAFFRITDSIDCFQAGNAYTIEWAADNFPVAEKKDHDQVLW